MVIIFLLYHKEEAFATGRADLAMCTKKTREDFPLSFLPVLFASISRSDITSFGKHFVDVIQDFFRFGANRMIVISAGDIHKLGGLAGSDTLDKVCYLKRGKNMQRRYQLAVYLMPHKNIHHRTTQVNDQGQFILGLFCGMINLTHPVLQRRFLKHITVMGGKNIITGTL